MIYIKSKIYSITIVIALLLALVSCKKDDTQPPIGAPLVSAITLQDVSDNGNASDFQVSFSKANNEDQISEYRIVLSKSSTPLEVEDIEQSARSRYESVLPTGQDISITLPSNFFDNDGEPVIEGVLYAAYVLSIADGTNAQANSLARGIEAVELLNDEIVLDRLITSEIQDSNISSLAVSAFANGEIVYTKGYGFNGINNRTPTNENTLYVSSSIAKIFVAVAVMQQVEQGKLDLDEDVSTYLGYEFRNPNFPSFIITPRILMTHRAAMSHPTNAEAAELNQRYSDSTFQLTHWVEDIMTPGGIRYNPNVWKNFSPGGTHSNSNTGIAILAHLVEKTSGLDFRKYAEENIFLKLDMPNALYKMDSPGFYDDKLLADIVSAGGSTLPPYSDFAIYPGVWNRISAKETANFLLAIANGGIFNGNRILEESTVQQMLKIDFPNANLAFNSGIALVWRAYDGDWIGHTGGGITTHTAVINPKTKKGFVILTLDSNVFTTSPDPNTGGIYRGVQDYLESF